MANSDIKLIAAGKGVKLWQVADKLGIAPAGNTGNANQLAQRELYIHILQIITQIAEGGETHD
mgnify:CR=1 FL=1